MNTGSMINYNGNRLKRAIEWKYSWDTLNIKPF